MKRTSALVRYGGFFLSVGTARVLGLLITSLTFPILVRRLGVETTDSGATLWRCALFST